MNDKPIDKNEETRKNPLQKLKEGLDDKEEQAVVITTLIKIIFYKPVRNAHRVRSQVFV